MDRPNVGSKGRTLTVLNPTGQVEVDGAIYQAETSLYAAEPERAAIPAAVVVVVSGWRQDPQYGVVVLVDPPKENAALPAAPSSPEERLGVLERQLQDVMANLARRHGTPQGSSAAQRSAAHEETSGPAWLLLTLGQVASVLVCVAVPFYAFVHLARAAELQDRLGEVSGISVLRTLWFIFQATAVVLYSAAMFVVFTRVKELPPST